jgi:hypothetical protein
MGEIVRFASKSERERIRLVREARAMYDSVFPPTDAVAQRRDHKAVKHVATAQTESVAGQGGVWIRGHS